MSEKLDPRLRLRIALRDLSPEEDPDDFAELVAAMLPFRDPIGALIPHLLLGPVDSAIVRLWACGAATPTPKFRREVVKFLRGRAAELAIQES